MFQALEARRLLAADLTTTQNGGALQIVGNSDANDICVVETGGSVTIKQNGILVDTKSGVTSILIKGQAQNDKLFYSGDSIGATIAGGSGDDDITVEDRGTGGSYVSGDGGNDLVTILDANETTVIGDGGNDKLVVTDQVDIHKNIYLYGMGGADLFNIAGGTNYIYGGGGDDGVSTIGTIDVDFAIKVIESASAVL